MVDKDNSPIQIIRKKEEESRDSIKEAQNDGIEMLSTFQKKLERDLLDYETALKEKGNEKLKKVKFDATELAKTEIAKANKERKATIDDASSRKNDATRIITETFRTLIEN